jgi:hypothetical protein
MFHGPQRHARRLGNALSRARRATKHRRYRETVLRHRRHVRSDFCNDTPGGASQRGARARNLGHPHKVLGAIQSDDNVGPPQRQPLGTDAKPAPEARPKDDRTRRRAQ